MEHPFVPSRLAPVLSLTLATHLLMACPSTAQEITVFRDVAVVPMTSETVLDAQDVVTRGSEIVAISPTGSTPVPQKATVIDGEGMYLMPGLADMHIHLDTGWPVDPLALYVANGVTTVRDMAGSELLPPLRREVEKGARLGPNLLGTSPCVWGWETTPSRLVVEHKKMGYTAQKINSYLSPRDFRLVMRQVKRRDMYGVCHIPFRVGLDGVLEAKMDEIAHIEELVFEMADLDRNDPRLKRVETEPECIIEAFEKKFDTTMTAELLKEAVRPEAREMARKIRAANVTICTTLATTELVGQKVNNASGVWARDYGPYFPKRFRNAMKSGSDRHLVAFRGKEWAARLLFEMSRTVLEELKAAGVAMVLGTDAGPWRLGTAPGFAMHDELRILTENGLSPYEAIALGTRNAAKVDVAMKGKGDFGTIEVKKRADLILLDHNPLDDVSHIRNHRGVMVAGKRHPREQLDQAIALKN